MRYLKALGYITLPVILALVLYHAVKTDPGIVVISGNFFLTGRDFTLTMTIAGFFFSAIVFFFVGYSVLRIIFKLLGLPRFLKRVSNERKEKSASRKISRAELAILENQPKQAEMLYISAVKHTPNPSLCYIGAARAAHIRGREDLRDQYLRAIETTKDEHNKLYAGILAGELLNKAKEYKKAQTVLERTRAAKGDHYRILIALANAYEKQGNYDDLYRIMPYLHKSLPKEDRLEVEPKLFIALIDHISESHDRSKLKSLWSFIPSNIKLDAGVVINYAEKLIYTGDVEEAEIALRNSLKKNWSDLVVTAYGHLYKGNFNNYIKHAKSFAHKHSDSPYASLAVAQLYYQTKHYEDALQFIHKALKINPNIPETHHLLAEILLEKGEYEKAALSFREAGRLTYAEPSAELLQMEGELLINDDTAKPEALPETVEANDSILEKDRNRDSIF